MSKKIEGNEKECVNFNKTVNESILAFDKEYEVEKYGMDTKEASRFIGCSAYTIRELARKKQIPHYRIGNRIMFSKQSLIKWIDKQENRNWKY